MMIIVARFDFHLNSKRVIVNGAMVEKMSDTTCTKASKKTMFMKHWWQQGDVVSGKPQQCAIVWNQMKAGTSYSILQRVYKDLPHRVLRWLTSMPMFITEINVTFKLDANGVPTIQW
jgi:hypothetical protein